MKPDSVTHRFIGPDPWESLETAHQNMSALFLRLSMLLDKPETQNSMPPEVYRELAGIASDFAFELCYLSASADKEMLGLVYGLNSRNSRPPSH